MLIKTNQQRAILVLFLFYNFTLASAYSLQHLRQNDEHEHDHHHRHHHQLHQQHQNSKVELPKAADVTAVDSTISMPPSPPSGSAGNVVRELFFDDGQRNGEVLVVTQGEDVAIRCQAVGTPMPSIHWLYRGRRIIQGGRHDVRDDLASFESESDIEHDKALNLGSTKSRLFIDCARPSDAGVYSCVAETPTKRIVSTVKLHVVPMKGKRSKKRGNGVLPMKTDGSDEGVVDGLRQLTLSDSCLNRHSRSGRSPARIYQWTSQRLANEGRDTQLFCRASGNPPPMVTWYDRNEREILPDDAQHKILPNGDLLIRDVTWAANMGLYHCKAHNDFGSDAINTFLYPTTA